MAGISNLRPPRPKYCTIWDVQVVLDYLSQWSDYKGLQSVISQTINTESHNAFSFNSY